MSNSRIKSMNQKFIDSLVLLFFSVIILYKTGFSGIINKTDFHFPIIPIDALLKSLFVWNDFVTGYFSIPNILKIWPRNILTCLLSVIFNISIAQRIYLLLLFFGLAYSGYYLIYTILNYEKRREDSKVRLCSLVTGIFFLYNPFVLFHINGGQFEYLYSLMGMNFAYAFLLKFIIHRKYKINYKYLILSVLMTTFIFSSTYSGIFLGIIFLITILLFIVFIKSRKIIIYILLFLMLICLLNMFIILSLLSFTSSPSTSVKTIENISSSVLRQLSSHDLIDILRLWVPNVENRFPFHPEWSKYFSSAPIRILGLGLFTFSLISLLTKNKNRFIIFSSINLILFLNMSFGLKSMLFSFLWSNIPLFVVFRVPAKFYQIILIHLSILFAYALYCVFEKVRRIKLSIFLSLLLVSLIVINVRPMISGNLEGSLSPVNYPSDYFIAKENIEKDKTLFRVLVLPTFLGVFKCGYYTWHKNYDFVSPIDLIIQRTVIDAKPLPRGSMESIMIISKFTKDPLPYENILDVMNVKYIIIHHDLLDQSTKRIIKYKYYDIIIKNSDVNFILKLKNIDVLKYNNSKPRIYITDKVIVAKENWILNILNTNTTLFPTIILSELPRYTSFTHAMEIVNSSYLVKVQDGSKKPFSWNNISNNSIEARYYKGRKPVIVIGSGHVYDVLSFPSLKDCPYKFPPYSPKGWNAHNSTLIFIKTGSKPLRIDEILENGKPVRDIIGIWWETGWMGMGTKPVEFPVEIPPHQRAIIQIDHIIKGKITICSLDLTNLTKLNEIKTSIPTITFKRVNPTKYIVSVENATKPFFLVFSESFNPQWKIYIEDRPTKFDEIVARYPKLHVREAKHDWFKFTPEDIVFLFKKPAVNETLHFKANGYANAWYIDPKKFDKDGDGKFTIIIYFLPQSLFYLGLFISGTTLFGCIAYLFYDWRREKGDEWAKRIEGLLKRLRIRKRYET